MARLLFIHGPSGIGKSTVLKALCGYEVQLSPEQFKFMDLLGVNRSMSGLYLSSSMKVPRFAMVDLLDQYWSNVKDESWIADALGSFFEASVSDWDFIDDFLSLGESNRLLLVQILSQNFSDEQLVVLDELTGSVPVSIESQILAWIDRVTTGTCIVCSHRHSNMEYFESVYEM